MDDKISVPVTVFTGYLGAGKTTIITNVLKQLSDADRYVWLKNEYGDIEVDSELVRGTGVQVKEVINGCLCCILIGRLGDALKEIVETYKPIRIIIETSGSAYPGPIALELNKLTDIVALDAMVTVIDAINFPGYVDKSYTAKLQTKYTDLILLNKHESVDERRLDDVLDDVFELNPDTPKIKTDHGLVTPELIFGLSGRDDYGQGVKADPDHYYHELEKIEFKTSNKITKNELISYLERLSPENIYRLKGIFATNDRPVLINYVARRYQTIDLTHPVEQTSCLVIGERLKKELPKLIELFSLQKTEIKTNFIE